MKVAYHHPCCVDDFGNEVYKSSFSKRLVTTGIDLKIFPDIVPDVKIGGYIGHVDELALWKQSVRDFQMLDANCNTCQQLRRYPHPKDKGGFLYGKCASGKETQYKNPNGIAFHPSDPMHMPCYIQREATK